MEQGAIFDTMLGQTLSDALKLSETALSTISSLLPEDCTFGTMPQSSIYRLHAAATVNYRGGLTCLRWVETSMATVPLLRSMLETWSHIDFIGDDTQGGDSRCRALRYERGLLKGPRGPCSWASRVRGPWRLEQTA